MNPLNIVRSVTNKGVKKMVIEVPPGYALIAVNPNSHYKLGHPLGDVVHADRLLEAEAVTWCDIEQRWV